MAKNTRKPSRTQRDKLAISIAKKLKEAGIISKQAKLHGGHYISQKVLRRVKEHQAAARLNYGTVKVSKEIARAAKERGYQVVQGNRIIGPKTPSFRHRLQSGQVTGVKPVKGGFMEEVYLPHTIYDLRSLIENLDEGGIDTLKLPGEHFAFKYKGAESYRAFMNSADLLKYLQHYKGITTAIDSNKVEDLQEEFEAITLFRLHRDDIDHAIPNMKERQARKAQERRDAIARGEYVPRRTRKKTRSEYLDSIPKWKKERILAKAAEYDRNRRAALIADPEKLNAYKAAAKRRAKASADRRKK